MALTATLAELRAGSLERADMIGSAFRTNAQVNSYVNASLRKLYMLLVAARGADYFESSSTVTTVAGTATYNLPATFLSLTAVETSVDGLRVHLDRFMPSERQWARDQGSWGLAGLDPLYRVVGSTIEFSPVPTTVYTVTLRFVPTPTTLVNDADTFDGIAGWEEWSMWDVAAVLQAMQARAEASFSIAQRDMVGAMIQSLAADRDSARPQRVRDSYLYRSPRTPVTV